MKQSEASLKKEFECVKSSNECLVEENKDLQRVIASQELAFEDFRQWVEDTYIIKAGFTTFSTEEIEDMVSNNDVIGSGGYGQVYKASFDGQDVAVKILNPGSGQGLREFQTEVRNSQFRAPLPLKGFLLSWSFLNHLYIAGQHSKEGSS